MKKTKIFWLFVLSFLLINENKDLKVYASETEYVDYATYNVEPFLEREFSDDDIGDVEIDVWQSYNANLRTCSSSFKPSTTHPRKKNITIYTSDIGIQTVPYVAYFSNGSCSDAAAWQIKSKNNDFFREQYGTMVLYMPVSMSYPAEGSTSLRYVYANQKVTNRHGDTFVDWGVPLNSNRCGYGQAYPRCPDSYGGGNGRETYYPNVGRAGEWEDIGYSGDGYGIINSHFPTNFPKYPSSGAVRDYKFDTPFKTSKTPATTYDTGVDATKTKIKSSAIDRLIQQEGLSGYGTKSQWMQRLSLKNNASTEAGVFIGTSTSTTNNKTQTTYTAVVTHAQAEARYNLTLEQVQLIYNGSAIGSYVRSPLQEHGTQTNPSNDLYGGKPHTLRVKIKNDSPVNLSQNFEVKYTVDGVTKTATQWLSIPAGEAREFDISITVPDANKRFDIVVQIPEGKHNLWEVDDKATIQVTTYRDTTAPTITNASVTTGCSASSATISVSSTDNPTNSYASGYKNTTLTRPDGTTTTSSANPATFNVSVDGSYKVSACDNNGNCTGTRTVTVNTIDKSAPTATISGVPSSWVNTDVTVKVSGTDPSHNCAGIGKVYWRINDSSWQSSSVSSVSITFNTTGNHKLDYYVQDKVGNTSSTKTAYIKIDKDRPTINSVTPVGTTHSSGMLMVGGSANSVTYDLSVYDAHSGVNAYTYAWNNDAWGQWISWSGGRVTIPLNSSLQNKVNDIWLKVKDAAGNWRTWTPKVLYDVTGPTINQSQIELTPYYNNKTTINVKVTAKDNFQDAGYTYVKYIYLSNDNQNWTRYNASNNSINVTWNTRTPDNTYTLYVKAEDSLGNVGAVQTKTYVTDQTKPTGSITIDGGQNHFPNENTRLNFTYADNLSGVAKIEIYDINKGTPSNNVYTINNPSSQKRIDWVLKPYTMSDGSIRAQVGMKITDKAGNVRTVTSKEVYISRVTINDFHLTNVVNPLVYNKNNPFKRLSHPNIPEQQLLAGGSFSFESNYTYPLGSVHNPWRVTHVATVQYQYPNGTIRNIEMTDSKVSFSGKFAKVHEIPFDVPVGTRVYIKINVKLHDSSGAVFTEDYYSKPNGTMIYLGKIQDDIRNVLNFNEIK